MIRSVNPLNSPRATYSVIGNICQNPQLLREPEVDLTQDDFETEFHKVLFSAINNLTYSDMDVKGINEIDIDNYLSEFPQLYKVWSDQEGLSYVHESIKHSNESTFKSNYERVKKFSILRTYEQQGISAADLYNYEDDDLSARQEAMKNLDNMSINQIIEHFTMKVIELREKFHNDEDVRDFTAGDGIDGLLERLTEVPEFGNPFQNGFYNTIFRGKRKNKYMLRSADTGTGKTRQALADMCYASASQIYNIDKDKWMYNGPSESTLFISTELEKEELQTVMLAIITGVNQDVIKDGAYSKSLKARLQHGIEIIKQMPLFCVYIDDFSVSDIEMIIEKYIIQQDVMEVAFDYIQMTPKLSKSMADTFGVNLREDQVLVQLSSALKILANKYNVYITSSTQLNRNTNEYEDRGPKALRGGSATADKADHGVITFIATKKDHKNLKHILEQGFNETIPNYSHWIYKNRSGKNKLVIWSYMNLGNMREEVLFVTDTDFNIVAMSPTEIEYDEAVETAAA